MLENCIIKQSIRSKAKHLSLRINHKGEVIITSPRKLSQKKIDTIVKENTPWIKAHLAKFLEKSFFEVPEKIHLLAVNKQWHIQYQQTSSRTKLIPLNDATLIIYGNCEQASIKQHLKKWLNDQARIHLYTWLKDLSAKINLPYNSVSIGQHRSQWGSCGADKRISLNAKLLFLPSQLVEHVLIHELAHTVYFDHSARFWQLVATHDPHWQSHKKALKMADDYLPKWLR